MIKASQAVSSEIVIDRLIETLMRIATEHAGAERGLLVLLRGDAMQIEAEARTNEKMVEVTVRQEAVTPAEIPRIPSAHRDPDAAERDLGRRLGREPVLGG